MTRQAAIFVGVGANLASRRHGTPLATCRAAVRSIDASGIRVMRCSRWYRSRPVPPSGQPDYVNGVVLAVSRLGPVAMLALLHRIEAAFGRRRGVRNAPRTLDLDLLAYGRRVREGRPALPHPRLHERAFVLRPMAELAPGWVHPRRGVPLARLLAELPPDQEARPFAPAFDGGRTLCPADGRNITNESGSTAEKDVEWLA